MGKLVRTIRGHMIDVVLDIRKGSPTYGRIIAHDMPVQGDEDYANGSGCHPDSPMATLSLPIR